MKTLQQDRSEINCLFVHSEIDDYGLSAQEFRVYAHLARRAGNNGAWPSVNSMAEKCRLHRDTVYECLKRLKSLNLVHAVKRPGTTTIYTLSPRSQWKDNQERMSEFKGYPSISHTRYRKTRDTQVSESKGHKGNPDEGYPLKDNTVGEQPVGNELLNSQHIVQKVPSSIPNGSSPKGEPAMFRQNTNKLPQIPIQRKAYAIAELLRFYHWDNCKVLFAKQTARA